MSNEPDVIVEVAWTDNYSEPFPTWTDITDRVEGFSSSLGRSTEIDSIQAGTVNLVLNNEDGAFTPDNPSSPFYPNVRPRRQVRIRDAGTPAVSSTPALINEVVNPWFFGDSIDTGYTINGGATTVQFQFAPSDGPLTFVDRHGAEAGGNYEVIAHKPDGSLFACKPGDYVSAAAQFSQLLGPAGSGHWGYVAIEWYDEFGTYLSDTETSVWVEEDVWTGCYLQNALAPAGAWQCRLRLRTTGTNASYWGTVATPGLFVHGINLFDWNAVGDTAAFFSGASSQSDNFTFAWEGKPHLSRSLAYDVPDRTGELARGYIERWPVAFSGLLSEVTVPVVDSLKDFSTRELVNVTDWQVDRREPTGLFRFAEGSETRDFYDEKKPDRHTLLRTSYRKTHSIYDNNTVPYVQGGKPSLADGIATTSVRTMETKTISGVYDSAACLVIPIDPIDMDANSFSYTFLYQWHSYLGAMDANAFILKKHENGLGNGPEIRLRVSQGGGDMGQVELIDSSGDRWVADTGIIPSNTTVFAGLSWDHISESLRFCFGDEILGTLDVVGGDDVFFRTSDNAAAHAATILAGAEFDRLEILGHVGRTLMGLADHSMQYFAEWRGTALTLPDMYDILSASEGYPAQTVDSRIHLLLDVAEWPRALRRVEPGSSELHPATWETGTSALDWLRDSAKSANGLFYVDAAGLARYDDRHTRVKAASSVWTFDHDAGTGVESGLTFTLSEDDLINKVKLDNKYGVKMDITNSASLSEFGPVEKSLETRLTNDLEAIQYGYHLVNRYGEPLVRLDGATLNPAAQADGTLWAHALGVRIGDRVTIAGFPDTAPSPSMDFFVEFVGHDVQRSGDRLYWTVSLNLSPAEVSRGWVLGDAELSRLGHTTRLHF